MYRESSIIVADMLFVAVTGGIKMYREGSIIVADMVLWPTDTFQIVFISPFGIIVIILS